MCSLKGQQSLEPFFFCDRLPRIVFVSQWKMNNCIFIFSKVDSSAHTRAACAFHHFHAKLQPQIQPAPNSINFPFSFRLRFLKLTSQTIRVWQQDSNKAKYCWLIFCRNSCKKMNILPLSLQLYLRVKQIEIVVVDEIRGSILEKF